MKLITLRRLMAATVVAATTFAAVADSRVEAMADSLLLDFFLNERAPAGADVELGVWNPDIDACIETAKKTGIHLIAVWSREGCAHCKIFEHAIMSDVFREWVKKSGLILGF